MATKKYQAGGGYTNTTAGEIPKPPMKKGGTTKKYEVGGVAESESCGKPGKPRCRQKFKSKGKSTETKGGILGTLGAIAGGLGGYAAYKKLKEQQKGGATKYQKGGISRGKDISEEAAKRKASKGKGYISTIMGANPSGDKGLYVPYTRQGRKDAKKTGAVSSKEMKPSRQIMKTGGVVNPNAKAQADKTPGSKGVKSGVNTKAAASKVARGRVGGTSTAPKTAVPRAKYGMSMRRK